MLVQMLMLMCWCWCWCLCGSARTSAGNGGTFGGGGGGGGCSYCLVYHFFADNPNCNPSYERGPKGGNPKCDAFKSTSPLIYLEKRYIEWHKMGNRRQAPSIPYTDEDFVSHNCILIVTEYL